MFGPPCHKCGSEFGWLPDKDGEECSCGWPDKKVEVKPFNLLEEIGFVLMMLCILFLLCATVYLLICKN